MRRKLQEGIFPWGPPLGYKSSVLNDEKKTLPDLPDEPTFGLLRKAWKEFASGAHTLAAMGRLMESWGLASVNGKIFAPQSLHQLFTNGYYAGILFDPWTREEYEGKHLPMVTREEFARVQEVIAARNRSTAHQRERDEFPLRGLVRCKACQGPLTAAFSRGRSNSYPYYLCQRRGCSMRGKSHPAADVHAEFTSFLEEIAPRPQLVREIGERVIKVAQEGERELAKQRQRRRMQITQLETETDELIRMRAQGLINNEEFSTQKKRLSDQRTTFESHGRDIANLDRVQGDLQLIVEPLAALRATWKSLKRPFRSRFERLILPGGFVMGNIRTADLGLLFSTFGASSSGLSTGVPHASIPSNRFFEEIQSFRDVLNGVEGPEKPKKRSFENSHRNRLRWRSSNPKAA
jgi:hypothetical protein